MAKRTQAQIAMLYPQTDQNVDKATQTEIRMREVLVEIEDRHCCLNTCCFCFLLVIMNLLYFQWLYMKIHLKTI